jgi:hypothetical protein
VNEWCGGSPHCVADRIKQGPLGLWLSCRKEGKLSRDHSCSFRNILGRAEEEQRQARHGTGQFVIGVATKFTRWPAVMGLIPTFALPLAGEELKCSVAQTR